MPLQPTVYQTTTWYLINHHQAEDKADTIADDIADLYWVEDKGPNLHTNAAHQYPTITKAQFSSSHSIQHPSADLSHYRELIQYMIAMWSQYHVRLFESRIEKIGVLTHSIVDGN
jgi:hypothetical protein